MRCPNGLTWYYTVVAGYAEAVGRILAKYLRE